ncbi:unnamed protein product [Pleuronectes platessa]|uniref:Uncharacterized protein n=1 Tax=Pleuronectes platessa TaxID=8262 RepID=A0A9N7UHV4_PLEPL|nr:unnamed protein product [Pleuronectes platessa]
MAAAAPLANVWVKRFQELKWSMPQSHDIHLTPVLPSRLALFPSPPLKFSEARLRTQNPELENQFTGCLSTQSYPNTYQEAFVELYDRHGDSVFSCSWPSIKTVFGLAALGAAGLTIGAYMTQKDNLQTLPNPALFKGLPSENSLLLRPLHFSSSFHSVHPGFRDTTRPTCVLQLLRPHGNSVFTLKNPLGRGLRKPRSATVGSARRRLVPSGWDLRGLCRSSSRTPSDFKAVPKHCTCQPPSSPPYAAKHECENPNALRPGLQGVEEAFPAVAITGEIV